MDITDNILIDSQNKKTVGRLLKIVAGILGTYSYD